MLAERLSGLARSQLLADYSELVSADGTINHQDMTDYLHLSPEVRRGAVGGVLSGGVLSRV